MNRDKAAERRHRRAINAYGEEACRLAYQMQRAGNGARTVSLEGPVTIRTTQQADAAINAGRWLNDQSRAPLYAGNYAAERIVASQDSRPVNLDLRSTAQQRHASHHDAVGHDSVQPWSAGALFPCVIAYVERHAGWLVSASHELIAYGRREEYACRDDAEQVARALNASPNLRAYWARGWLVDGGAIGEAVRPHDQAGVS